MKKITKIIKLNLLGFVVGAILFSGITYVVATGIASSTVEYTTANNANIATVKDALDDLYVKTSRFNSWVDPYDVERLYWNDNFSNMDTGNEYDSNSIPTGTGLYGTYATRAELETAYGSSNFANRPAYIKSTKVNGIVVGHLTCLWYNNNEYCMEPNYWVGDAQDQSNGVTTKAKLKADMEAVLGITIADSICSSTSSYARCYTDSSIQVGPNNFIGDFLCEVYSDGGVCCGANSGDSRCIVRSDGSSYCTH